MPKSKKYTIYITYTENRTGGEPLSNEPYSTREDTFIDIKWNNVYTKDPKNIEREVVEIDFNPEKQEHIYIVVVRYQDGDSYSFSHGNWCFVGAYETVKEAQEIIDQIKYDDEDYDNEDYDNKKEKYKGYKPWNGYFAKLEDVELNALHVL